MTFFASLIHSSLDKFINAKNISQKSQIGVHIDFGPIVPFFSLLPAVWSLPWSSYWSCKNCFPKSNKKCVTIYFIMYNIRTNEIVLSKRNLFERNLWEKFHVCEYFSIDTAIKRLESIQFQTSPGKSHHMMWDLSEQKVWWKAIIKRERANKMCLCKRPKSL